MAAQRKFTRGEWHVTPGGARKDSNFGGYAEMVHAPGPARVAKVYGGAQDKRDECEANAHLIAAAPDLYAALRDVARWIDTLPDDLRLGSIMPEKIRAAIRKADGNA